MKLDKTIIDLRSAVEFCEQHILGSYSVSISEQLDFFIDLIDENLPVLFIVNNEQLNDSSLQKKCRSISKEFILFEDAKNTFELDVCISLDTEEFVLDYKYDEFYLVDVRTEEAYENEHLEHASTLPLDELSNAVLELDSLQTYYIYADSAEEACFAASVFKKNGIHFIRVALVPFAILQTAINA